MKKQLPFVAFSLALLGLSSCASLEHLTDDRSRLEDDEVYWNRQELFYSPIAANADPYVLGEDDYFNPNSIPNANQLNGGRNQRFLESEPRMAIVIWFKSVFELLQRI